MVVLIFNSNFDNLNKPNLKYGYSLTIDFRFCWFMKFEKVAQQELYFKDEHLMKLTARPRTFVSLKIGSTAMLFSTWDCNR